MLISKLLYIYIACKGFGIQTHLWSLELVFLYTSRTRHHQSISAIRSAKYQNCSRLFPKIGYATTRTKQNHITHDTYRHELVIAVMSARNSPSQMFFKIGVLKKFCNIHRKTSVLQSLFNKVSGFIKNVNFIEKRLQHRCFSVNIAKFLRTAFSQNFSRGCF